MTANQSRMARQRRPVPVHRHGNALQTRQHRILRKTVSNPLCGGNFRKVFSFVRFFPLRTQDTQFFAARIASGPARESLESCDQTVATPCVQTSHRCILYTSVQNPHRVGVLACIVSICRGKLRYQMHVNARSPHRQRQRYRRITCAHFAQCAFTRFRTNNRKKIQIQRISEVPPLGSGRSCVGGR